MQGQNHAMRDSLPLEKPGPTVGTATLMIMFTALCFGLVPLFARELQAAGTDSATIALYRSGASALLLLPWLPTAREKRFEAVLLLGAGVAMGLGWAAYLEALKVAPVALAGVVYMSYPLFTLLFAWLALGHRPSGRSWATVALIFAAAALALGPAGSADGANTHFASLLFVLPAPITFGFIIVVVSACVTRLTPVERMACAMLGSVAGLSPISAGLGAGSGADWLALLGQTWPLIIGLTALTAFIPQLIYSYAAPLVGPQRSAAAGSVELPMMFAVGWLAFGEVVGFVEVIAAGLVIAAVVISPPLRGGSPAPASPSPRTARTRQLARAAGD